MISPTKLFIYLLLFPLFISCASSDKALQTAQTSAQEEQILNLIVQLPAGDETMRRHVFGELIGFGPEGIHSLADILVPAGIGDDTYVRYALNGLARYVSRPGAEAERRMYEEALLEELKTGSSAEVKTFLMSQLELTGSDRSVPLLQSYLTHPSLYNPATHALTAIGTPAAQQALQRNLAATGERQQATILKALGDLQSASVAGNILPYASSENSAVKDAALYALARMGQPGAGEALTKAVATSSSYRRTRALSLQLIYARRLAEEGYLEQSNDIARDLFDSNNEAYIKSAALSQLVNNEADEAGDKLLAAAGSSDAQLRGAAFSLASALSESITAETWLQMLGQSSPQVQADIIGMLGHSKDASAVSDIKPFLDHEHIEVRRATIAAFTALAGETALPVLIDQLVQATDQKEIDALKSALLRMPAQELPVSAAEALPSASDQAKIALIEILDARQATNYAGEILNHAGHSNSSVRLAALQALEPLAGPDDLPALIDLLTETEDDQGQGLVRQAIISASKDMDNPQDGTKLILTRLENTNGILKISLLRLLPRLGGSQALSVLADATTSAEPNVRRVAIETLARWPEPSAIPPLLDVLETSSGADSEEAAGGLARLVPASRYSAEDKVRWLNQAADAASTPRGKTEIIKALASLQSPEALKTVAAYLAHHNRQVREAAVQGMAAMLASSGQSEENLTVADGALSILETAVSPKLRRQVEQQIRRIRTSEREADEFTPLFNGRDLSGWTGATDAYRVEEGAIISQPGTNGNLYTEDQYSDFVLRFEFRLTEGANNGLGIRAPLEGDAAYEGLELQILDNTAQRYADLQPYQYHGSVYGIVPARRGHLNPIGQWNTQEVIARGTHITVKLNGTTILDADVNEAAIPEPADDREHPGLERSSGHIGFLGHGSQVAFRNIRIKDLTRYFPDYSMTSGSQTGLNQPPEGFQALFNGEDLSGWKGLVGNPETRAQMSAQELAREQAKADSLMRAHWSVRDGILYFDGEGSHLCTIDKYEDFEMLLDWKIEPGGDSGVYLRGSPQVQIWDVTEWPQGSGGLYNNQQHPSNPLKVADRPIGEWNRMRIKMIGEQVTVHLNGELIVSDVVMENFWDREKSIYPVGQIELQSHNTPLQFRNIFIREIPGTEELFNGQDLTGWQRVGEHAGSWNAADGILSTQGGGGGWLSTSQMYDDFKLELEYRLPEGGNSGVFLRAPLEGNPAYEGMEIQLLDDYAERYSELRPWQYTGSIYDVQAPSKQASKQAGQWQKMVIIADGPMISVNLNNQRILHVNLADYMDQTGEHPGLKRRQGYIGLQNHGSRVDFRNIKITEIE